MSHKLVDINSLTMRTMFGNFVSGVLPILAINLGGAATVKTTNAISYAVDGRRSTKAVLAAVALAVNATLQPKITYGTSFYVQPISTTVYYVLLLDAAGTVTTLQGQYTGQTFTGSSVPLGASNMPDPEDAAYSAFGMIKIVTNGATTFTPGTTALDAAGLTVTFYDLNGCLPATNP